MGDPERIDIAIVGAGAAGLMAGIWAGREAARRGASLRIAAFDGAKKVGVKILVAGGGRCNVTHHEVTERDYAGGSRHAVRSVLRRFSVEQTVSFFESLGVRLKREETGKLFPTTDKARTVLEALLGALRDAGVGLDHPRRVERLERLPDGSFLVGGAWGSVNARRVVLATGGKALPRSGSDGGGYRLAQALGHSITAHVVPALAPLVLAPESSLRDLSGLAAPATLELRAGAGKRLASFTNSTLCTHFGLSGPAPMDMSRHLSMARLSDPDAHLTAQWLPDATAGDVDQELRSLGPRTAGRWLRERLPERLAITLCREAGVDPATTGAALTRDARRGLVAALFHLKLPVTGDRGFTHAEATAGGVPLDEIKVSSMASRRCEGLHLCGEICDVDGRIGGFNFQWAWSSGWIAGRAAAASLTSGAPPEEPSG